MGQGQESARSWILVVTGSTERLTALRNRQCIGFGGRSMALPWAIEPRFGLSDADIRRPNSAARGELRSTTALSRGDLEYMTVEPSAVISLRPPVEWSVLSTLQRLMDLPPNWDSYGGIPATHESVEAAEYLLSSLMAQGVAAPALVPNVGRWNIHRVAPSFASACNPNPGPARRWPADSLCRG